jgi:Fis family transcriptional regulator, factor for inversion stimulation protein
MPAIHSRTSGSAASELPLRHYTEQVLTEYFTRLNGHAPADLHQLVLREVEEPLLRIVMERSAGNQSRAAAMLGITRTTLRKKLKQFGLAAA